MKGVDTNILVRYIVQDDPIQGEKASQLIDQMLADEESCFINNIVLCELVWVLESSYSYKKEEIAEVIEKILTTIFFEFENKDALWWSLNQYKNTQADFSDCLISRINKNQGCTETFSFDKGVKKLKDFKMP